MTRGFASGFAFLFAASRIACSGDDTSSAVDSASPERGADGQPLVTHLDGTYELSSTIDRICRGLAPKA